LRRRLFTLCSAVSLVLCVAVLAVWGASYRVQFGTSWTEPKRLSNIGVTRGTLFASEVLNPPGYAGTFGSPYGRRTAVVRPPTPLTTTNLLTAEWRFAGFEYLDRSPPRSFRRVAVPCWALAMALAAAPALWYRRRRTKLAGERAGLCPACGYDLRATPDRCPECGAASQGHTAAA
jgi:hypothetical protein